MDNKLQKLNSLKNIKLSESEKSFLKAHMVHVMHTATPEPSMVRSMFQRGVHHGLRIALSSMLFVVFAGGTVSAIADNALPGDPLYAFKLNVNEKVKGMFLNTPEEKVAYQKKRIENRVDEIKTLAESQTLTKAKQETVKKALDSHIADLSKDLNTLSPSDALTATTKLEESLKANKQTIKDIPETQTNTSDKEKALEAVDVTLQKVSDQEVKIISKELDAISTSVNDPTVNPSTTTSLDTSVNKTNTTTTPVGP